MRWSMESVFYEALKRADDIPALGRSAAKIKPFVTFIQTLRSQAEFLSVHELLSEIIEQTGYVKELEAEDTDEATARIENIDELITKVVSYEEEEQEPTLGGFLEEVALVADIDSLEEESNHVVLMTLHGAKGLEFPNVYLAGLEDGVFPSYMTIMSDDPTDIEEERRLCYVGITRAMQHLTLTSARQRMIRGETQYNRVSRFIQEIPRDLVSIGIPLEPKVKELPKQTAYIQAKMPLKQKAFEPKDFKVTKSDSWTMKWAIPSNTSSSEWALWKKIVEGGKDYEVTVNFEKAGVKKMFAAFAKLKKFKIISIVILTE